MKLNSIILILLFVLAACSSNKPNEQANEPTNHDLVEFPKFNSKFLNQQTLSVTDELDRTFDLDSTQYSIWTDKIVPYKTEKGRLYSAQLYSVQPQQDNFGVLTLKVHGDHWFKLHLVTIDKELQLIDQIPISDSWSDLLDQYGDFEIVGRETMYTKMISDKEYQNIDIRTKEIINYHSDSTTYEIDSILSKIEILNDGTFKLTKLDSIRTVKYGGID
jgi:hypothetical protein